MSEKQSIVLASNNIGKVTEFQEMLGDSFFHLLPQSAYEIHSIEETGSTFIENALLKARHASKGSGMPALADDSGLVVDALGGEPGVHSSRFAGEGASEWAYTQKLLDVMHGIPEHERTARFVCILAFLNHPTDPLPIIVQAVWEGRILTERRGKGGFGYDPIFYVPEFNCAAAELTPAQKHSLSHRGKAFKIMKEQLHQRFFS